MTATFDTSVLDAALQRRRQQLETERARMLECVRRSLLDIRTQHGIGSAYIIGSLSRPAWHRASDVDVAVSGCSGRVLEVMAALEEASDRPVDVVDLDRHPSAPGRRQPGRRPSPLLPDHPHLLVPGHGAVG